ncbi:MAG: tRNA (N(6)-L-threonylcarbamoyladenosine(37)-C(2))-methylthiotransferase MtaB [Lachnospiraceae bacterium]|nr:tRNA (N(6)-L-threonylcarbamoyladenosine(37)-C(2))-methylthiotransferase MtaB [Lachnospiraceae bacterium]
MKRLAYHNLGCKVNYYELEAVLGLMKNEGYSVVGFDEEADVYIINTCSVTNTSDQKSRQMINRARQRNKDAVVIAMGCFIQENANAKNKSINADILIGNNRKHNILEDIEKYKSEKCQIIDCEDINNPAVCYENLSMEETSDHTRAFIKIQDGCNEFCSYCIIPYARGRVRSKDIDEIVDEVTKLSEKGCREFVLTGIHISSYSYEQNNEKLGLIDVIERIANIDGVSRIRLGSLEPRIITKEFVERLAKIDKICPHFHLSLQSGSDSVLKRMNRKYTTEEYYDSCILLREYFKQPAITTDVIVGFPGETKEEFDETYSFFDKIHFYEMHVFKYSRRQGTKADRMANQIDEKIKKERSAKLLELNKKMSDEYREGFIDKELDVLFEEEVLIDEVRYFQGYSKRYIKALIKTDEDLSNQIVECCGKEIMNNALLVEKLK